MEHDEENNRFHMFIGADDPNVERVLIKFHSIFNEDGRLKNRDEIVIKEYEYYIDSLKNWNIEGERDGDWIKKFVDDKSSDCFIAGMYMPIIEENALEKYTYENLLGDSPSEKMKIYSIWSYSTIENIKSCPGDVIHEQDFFNFPIDFCADFGHAEIRKTDADIHFDSDSFTIYSLRPYSTTFNTVANPIRVELEAVNPESGHGRDSLLYPSDVFSIRWRTSRTES